MHFLVEKVAFLTASKYRRLPVQGWNLILTHPPTVKFEHNKLIHKTQIRMLFECRNPYGKMDAPLCWYLTTLVELLKFLFVLNLWHLFCPFKVHKRTWTFEQNSMNMILRSNVHQRGMPLQCSLHGVSIQKVSQILRQKTGKIPPNSVFLLKSHRNDTNETESHCLATTKWSKVK